MSETTVHDKTKNQEQTPSIDWMSRHENNHKWNIYVAIALAAATHLVHAYFAKFAMRLGGGELEMAYLYTLPAMFGMISLIPGALLIDIIGKKRATTFFMVAHKFFYLLMAFVPLLPDTWPRPFIFVMLVAAMNLPGSIYTNGFNSSVGDLFLPHERGSAIANRTKVGEIARIAITVLSGIFMLLPKTNDAVVRLYQVYFVIAFLLGLMEVYGFNRFDFPDTIQNRLTTAQFRLSLKQSLVFCTKNKTFILYTLSSLTFYFGWQFGWPLFSVYQVKTLGATEGYLAAFAICAALSSIIANPFWVKFIDKNSAFQGLALSTFGMTVTPLVFILCTTRPSLAISNLFSGTFIVGTTMAFLLIMLQITPVENRTTIMSIHATLVSISQAIVPMLSIKFLEHTDIRTSLFATAGFRFLGFLALLGFFFYMKKSGKSTLEQDAA